MTAVHSQLKPEYLSFRRTFKRRGINNQPRRAPAAKTPGGPCRGPSLLSAIFPGSFLPRWKTENCRDLAGGSTGGVRLTQSATQRYLGFGFL